jgi:CBS domain-containing protein
MIVEDLMTWKAASVHPEQTLDSAAQLMWDCDCGAVPVVDEDARVVGIVTDRDICMATWSRGRAPGRISVAEVMSRGIFCCRPEDSIFGAEALMRANQIRRLPVVDRERRLVGILSLADIARAAEAAPKFGMDRDASGDGLATTLAGICRSPLQAISHASAR